MKKCPNCNDFALYDDDVAACPICGASLVKYQRRSSTRVQSEPQEVIQPIVHDTEPERRSNNIAPEFETKQGLRYVYRGTVTEISSRARYHNRFKKIVNALFRGEPYQFGNTSHETVFRVEGFHDGLLSGRKRDLIYYGDIEGRINYGDDVVVNAKKMGDRYIVTSLYSNETESQIKPPPQIPALLFWILIIAIALGIFYLASSGILASLLIKVATYAILIIGFLIFLGIIFGGK